MATATATRIDAQQSRFTRDAVSVWNEIRRLGLEYHVAELDALGLKVMKIVGLTTLDVFDMHRPYELDCSALTEGRSARHASRVRRLPAKPAEEGAGKAATRPP